MVKDIVKYLRRPVVLSAVVCAILIYSGIISVKARAVFKSAIPIEKTNSIICFIEENPSKLSSGKYYRVSVKAEEASIISDETESRAKARGCILMYIPSSLVESVYPGKLFSLAGKKLLVEKGEKLKCRGKWSKKTGAFFVQSAEYLGCKENILGKISHIRAVCRLIFKRLMFSWGPAGGFILSLLSGSREYIEGGLAESFRTAGLSHILALSGMHLSFFAGLTGKAGLLIAGKKISLVSRLTGILFFVWFAGLSPSLLRALLCSLFILAGRHVYCANISMLEVLSSVFLLHSAIRSEDIKTTAFILSYGALAGILIFSPIINKVLSPFVPKCISTSLSASTGAQAATTPVSISLFGSMTPIGIIASLAISPLITIFLTFALVSIILSLSIPFLSPIFGGILNTMYAAIKFLVKLFACIPAINFR